MSDMNNKVALIKGASSGIGRATAELFAERSAKVVVAARKQNELHPQQCRSRSRSADVDYLMPAKLIKLAHQTSADDSHESRESEAEGQFSNVSTNYCAGLKMSIKKVSSREFNQAVSRVKKAAGEGPMFITERGRPSHVLMTIEHYQRLSGAPTSLADALAMTPEATEVALEVPRLDERARGADL